MKLYQTFRAQMQKLFKQNQGFGTLELVIIISVLIAVALIFREQLTKFSNALMQKVFDSKLISELGR